MGEIKAVIVDDSARMREAIKDVLRTVAACKVVGEGANGLEALELARRLHPDVIVLDINMPIMGGMEALRLLRSEFPCTSVVMVTSILEPMVRDRALNSGAVACLQKGDELWHGLKAVVMRLSEIRLSRQTST